MFIVKCPLEIFLLIYTSVSLIIIITLLLLRKNIFAI